MNYEMFTSQVTIRKHGKPEIGIAGSAEIQKEYVKEYRKIEFNKGKQAPCADTYLMREAAKERNINWCEEYKLNKIKLVNYTERGKQLINIGLRKYQKQGGQIKVKGQENPLTGVRKIGVVQYQIINKKFHQPKKLRLKKFKKLEQNTTAIMKQLQQELHRQMPKLLILLLHLTLLYLLIQLYSIMYYL